MSMNTYHAVKRYNVQSVSVMGHAFDEMVEMPTYIHEPETLPTYEAGNWVVFGVPLTIIPTEFRAVLKRGRGRGKGRTIREVERKTVLPSRVAAGATRFRDRMAMRDEMTEREAEELGMAENPLSVGKEPNSSLVAIGAGKPVTGDEATWEDLM